VRRRRRRMKRSRRRTGGEERSRRRRRRRRNLEEIKHPTLMGGGKISMFYFLVFGLSYLRTRLQPRV